MVRMRSSERVSATERRRHGGIAVRGFGQRSWRLGWLSRRLPQSLVFLGVATLATGCSPLVDHEPSPSNAMLMVLIDVSPTGRALADAQRSSINEVVIPLAAKHRAAVLLTVTDDYALDDPHVDDPVSFDTAAAGDNPQGEQDIIDTASASLREKVQALLATPSTSQASDVAGTVEVAANALNQRHELQWKGIVVLADATSTAPPCNFSLVRPWVDVEGAISTCYPFGVPAFAGTRLFFVGAGSDPTREGSRVQAKGIESFWREVANQGGGVVDAYGPLVSGPPL